MDSLLLPSSDDEDELNKEAWAEVLKQRATTKKRSLSTSTSTSTSTSSKAIKSFERVHDDQSTDKDETEYYSLNTSKKLVYGGRAWEIENKKDVLAIEKWLDAKKDKVFNLEALNNASYKSGSFPEWRLLAGTRTLAPAENYGYERILRTQSASFVSYESLNVAAQLESDVQLLGCVSSAGSTSGFLSYSNNETRTFEYVRDNVEALLQNIPLYGGSYRSTPAQRLGSAIKGATLPVEVKVMMKKCSATGSAVGKPACFGLCKSVRTRPTPRKQLFVDCCCARRRM